MSNWTRMWAISSILAHVLVQRYAWCRGWSCMIKLAIMCHVTHPDIWSCVTVCVYHHHISHLHTHVWHMLWHVCMWMHWQEPQVGGHQPVVVVGCAHAHTTHTTLPTTVWVVMRWLFTGASCVSYNGHNCTITKKNACSNWRIHYPGMLEQKKNVAANART